jgi:hypothetical protein
VVVGAGVANETGFQSTEYRYEINY